MKYCTTFLSGVENGHSNEKIAEKNHYYYYYYYSLFTPIAKVMASIKGEG